MSEFRLMITKTSPAGRQSLGGHHSLSSSLIKAGQAIRSLLNQLKRELPPSAELQWFPGSHPALPAPLRSPGTAALSPPINPAARAAQKLGQDAATWPSTLNIPVPIPWTHSTSLLTYRNLPAEPRAPQTLSHKLQSSANCREPQTDAAGAAGIIPALTGDTGWTLKEAVKGNGGVSTSWSLLNESGKDVSARNKSMSSVVRLIDRSL